MRHFCKRYLKYFLPIFVPLLLFIFILYVPMIFHNRDIQGEKRTKRVVKETKVYRWHGGKWHRIPAFCNNTDKFDTAKLRSPVGTIGMYIHDVVQDNQVSKSITKFGMWDRLGINTMLSHLADDPDMGLLDLGSHIGVFTVVAALMGRRVVAVDPLVENVLRLCKTIQDANMAERVTILFTALSDTYETVSFKRGSGNLGNTYIQKMHRPVTMNAGDNYNANYISSVHLDDILPFVNFSKVFIKIDVENHEYEVLKKGTQLFETRDVRAILMEWFHAKLSLKSDWIMKLLYEKKFKAVNPSTNTTLLPLKFLIWPNDIVWVKK